MSLLTLEQANRIPELYSQEEVEDPTVYLKITCLNSFWLITEFDPEKELAFGYCEIIPGGGELGYVSLEEIEDLPYPIQIEEIKQPLSEVKKGM
jgi:hypothetical protein